MSEIFKAASALQPAIAIPTVTIAEAERIHQSMTADVGVSVAQRIETSGLRVAETVQRLLTDDDSSEPNGDLDDRPIVILVGLGDLGAVGLVAARCLDGLGGWVQVVTTHPAEAYLSNDVMPELASAMSALQAEGVATAWAEDGWELPPADLLIDALPSVEPYGSSLDEQADLARSVTVLIQLANSHHAPVLSVGVPAGIEPDTGGTSGPYLSALATVALGLPLKAMGYPQSNRRFGESYLADIDIPSEIYSKLGVDKTALFTDTALIKIEYTSR